MTDYIYVMAARTDVAREAQKASANGHRVDPATTEQAYQLLAAKARPDGLIQPPKPC